jgi:hypothetical protein
MPSSNRHAAAAERLARRGWPVLPCHHPVNGCCSCGDPQCASPAKHPRTRHGLRDASVEADRIEQWWSIWPDANLAIRTGARPAGVGVVVLDIDPAHGGDTSLADLRAVHGAVPVTLEVRTGGGGRHLYFAHPGGQVPSSAGRVGAGLDVRGDGGYVLAPPSRHASGTRYQWVRGPLRPLPGWLADLACDDGWHQRADAGPAVVRRADAWAAAALAGEVATVRRASQGWRNHTLNRAAFALGQLVAGSHLDADHVTAALTEAARAAGLTPKETQATIASGLRAGAARPRQPARR